MFRPKNASATPLGISARVAARAGSIATETPTRAANADEPRDRLARPDEQERSQRRRERPESHRRRCLEAAEAPLQRERQQEAHPELAPAEQPVAARTRERVDAGRRGELIGERDRRRAPTARAPHRFPPRRTPGSPSAPMTASAPPSEPEARPSPRAGRRCERAAAPRVEGGATPTVSTSPSRDEDKSAPRAVHMGVP